MFKRVGVGMLPGGAANAEAGSFAVLCPACLQAGTLPESDSPLLNTLFVMLDGNFCMKCKDRNLNDPSLGPGLSYFIDEKPYKEYLEKCGNQKEVSDFFWFEVAFTCRVYAL